MMEWAVVSIVPMVATTAAVSALRFRRILKIDAQDGDFDAAIGQFAKHHVYSELLANNYIGETLFLACFAHASAVSDLQHVGQVVDLERDGFTILIHRHNFASQLLLDRFLRGGGCGCDGSGGFILRLHRLGDASGQRQQQAEDNGCFDYFHCLLRLVAGPRNRLLIASAANLTRSLFVTEYTSRTAIGRS